MILFRKANGENPLILLNNKLKELRLSKPDFQHTSPIGNSVFCSKSLVACKRIGIERSGRFKKRIGIL